MTRSKQGDGSRPPGAGDSAMSPQVQARYRAVRQAMLDALPTDEPGLTFEQLVATIGKVRSVMVEGRGFVGGTVGPRRGNTAVSPGRGSTAVSPSCEDMTGYCVKHLTR